MTGAERMRDFRRRNPGYDRKYKAQRRAALKARQMAREAQKVAAFAEMLAPAQARDTLLLLPAPPVRLALPAPLLDPTMAAINALAMRRIQVPVAA